jgi:hypothetical protein
MDAKMGALNRCADVSALLPGYVEGELSAAENRRVAGHLEICAACRREETEYRQAMGLLRAPRETARPGDLYAGFAAKLAKHETTSARRQLQLRWAGMAACLLLIAGAGASRLLLNGQGLEKVRAIIPDKKIAAATSPDRTNRAPGQEKVIVKNIPTPDNIDVKDRTDDMFAPPFVSAAPSRSALSGGPNTNSDYPVRRQPHATHHNTVKPAQIALRSAGNEAIDRSTPHGVPGPGVADGGMTDRMSEAMPAGTVDEKLDTAALGKIAIPARKPVCIVQDMNERVRVGDTVTNIKADSGWDANGRLALIRIKAETIQIPKDSD